jgi:hypothetical protein
MGKASNLERLVRTSALALIAVSLLTGSTSYLNPPVLNPLWAVFSALATLLAAYGYFVGSGAKQFTWFSLGQKFDPAANEVEFLSQFVKLGKIAEDELIETWKRFSGRLQELLNEGGVEHRQHEAKNETALRQKT